MRLPGGATLFFKEYNKNVSKKYLFVVLVLLVLVLTGGGYYYWKTNMQPKVTTGVVSPVVNPVENVPNANPYDKTNPFSNIKVNPFD